MIPPHLGSPQHFLTAHLDYKRRRAELLELQQQLGLYSDDRGPDPRRVASVRLGEGWAHFRATESSG